MKHTRACFAAAIAAFMLTSWAMAEDAAAPADIETDCVKKCYAEKKVCMDEVQDMKKKSPGAVGRMRYKTKMCNSTFASCKNACKSQKSK